MKKTIKGLIKILIFCLIFMTLLTQVTKVLRSTEDPKNYQFIAGFYTEDKDMCDAVYVGSSTTYAFWNPLVAWNTHGIAVMNLTCASMPNAAMKYMIKEARKTQPDALYIVNVNNFFVDRYKDFTIHYLADYTPFSLNKLDMIYNVSKAGGYSFGESLEFYFPIIKYHSRWNSLTEADFDFSLNGLKGTTMHSGYLSKSTSIAEKYNKTNESTELRQDVKEILTDFLDYIEKENVDVLFITVPQASKAEEIMQFNAVEEMLTTAGYPVLSCLNEVEELNIDTSKDFYNSNHTNVHGSIKFTNYVSDYLVENYGFSDKRSVEKYQSWNDAFDEYVEIIGAKVLDIEYNRLSRDYGLTPVSEVEASYDNEKISVKWNGVEGADGYAVYRSGDSYALIGFAENESFADTDIKTGNSYRYIIVPYYEKDGEKVYGDFNYNSTLIKT